MPAAMLYCGNTKDGNEMVTLTFGDRIPAPESNTYTLTVTTYAGDANYYETFSIKGFRRAEDAALLNELLELFPAMKAAYPHGRGGDGDTYEEVESLQSFRDWFGDGEIEYRPDIEEFVNRLGQDFQYDWPWASDYGQEMTVDTWTLVYYDDNSNAFEVTVTY